MQELTDLMRAAKAGDIDQILKYKGTQLKKQNGFGQTALMIAVKNKQFEATKLLLDEQTIRDIKNNTSLYYAVVYDFPEIIPSLTQEYRMTFQNNQTALMTAASCGKVKAVEILKQFELKMVDSEGNTALMWSAKCKKFECAKILLEECGMQSNDGSTALMFAAENDCPDIIQLLILQEIGMQDSKGQTAFARGYQKKSLCCHLLIEEAEYVGSNGQMQVVRSGTLLMNAAKTGNLQDVQKYKKEYIRQQRDEDGYSALMLATEANHYECAKELLDEAGMLNYNGDYALILAIRNKNIQIIELLIPLELNVETFQVNQAVMEAYKNGLYQYLHKLVNQRGVLCKNGMSTLMMAAGKGNLEGVKQLKDEEMTLLSAREGKQGYTALMYAVEGNHIDCVSELLHETGKINENDDTALFIAIKNKCQSIIELLAPYETQMINKQGNTALIETIISGDNQNTNLFISLAGSTNRSNVFALMLAAQRGNVEVVKMLKEKEHFLWGKVAQVKNILPL